MKSRNLLIAVVAILVIALGGTMSDVEDITSLFSDPTPTTQNPKPSETLGTTDEKAYLVTKVIDGDTIEIEDGRKVRYIGIDTPELRGNECFAKEARDKNRELVEGKRVKLQKDVSETDRYGRLLRFVYLENGDFVNNILVKEGYATAATFPPDVAKQEEFKTSQDEARTNNRGLWGEQCNK